MRSFGVLAAALAAVFIGSAHAESVAYITNKAGGKIVFTNDICFDKVNNKSYEALLQLYAYSSTGKSVRGCYWYEKSSNLLHVTWEDTRAQSLFDADDLNFYK